MVFYWSQQSWSFELWRPTTTEARRCHTNLILSRQNWLFTSQNLTLSRQNWLFSKRKLSVWWRRQNWLFRGKTLPLSYRQTYFLRQKVTLSRQNLLSHGKTYNLSVAAKWFIAAEVKPRLFWVEKKLVSLPPRKDRQADCKSCRERVSFVVRE